VVFRKVSLLHEPLYPVGRDRYVVAPAAGAIDFCEKSRIMQSVCVAEGEAHRDNFSSYVRDFACSVGAYATVEKVFDPCLCVAPPLRGDRKHTFSRVDIEPEVGDVSAR
jgi:hypothetical protein